MARSWFRFSAQEEEQPQNGVPRNPSHDNYTAGTSLESNLEDARTNPRPPNSSGPDRPATPSSFEQIYLNSAVKPPRIPYGILKVAAMASSTHLAGMSVEAKRNSLLMALEAAGVEVEDVLQDAVVRQKALNDYEEALQQKLKEFETAKLEENNRIQVELDRMTSQYMSRIQSNLDAVAHEQDKIRAWQRTKQQEAQRITEAATFCVPQGSASNGLTEVLERATLARR